MKIYFTIVLTLIGMSFLNAQSSKVAQTTKVAILDFENTSGKSEYDGLGKALSNMLITDLKNNIYPQKVQFYERSQLNKILDEQSLQKSKAFDKKTAVDFGKLSGSDYVFVGSLFVLKGTCNISSRLVDVKTSEIILTKDVSGKIEDWLSLKSQLGMGIAKSLDLDSFKQVSQSKKTDTNALKLYTQSINLIDQDQLDSANLVLSELKYSYRSFDYTNDQFNALHQKALEKSKNIKLRQKAYILTLHEKVSSDPDSAWSFINTFWDGPLDEAYPYLEYQFLKKVYSKFKDDEKWMKKVVSRSGITCSLGEMILFAISNKAGLSFEYDQAIEFYNDLNEKYPKSELILLYGQPFEASLFLQSKIPYPNKDTIYSNYFNDAQKAMFLGVGLRNEKQMKGFLDKLIGLTELDFYDYVSSEYYLEFFDKSVVLINPYFTIALLVELVGNDEQKRKWLRFKVKNSDKLVWGNKIGESDRFVNPIKWNLMIRYCNSSSATLEDYQNKNWINYNSEQIASMEYFCVMLELLSNVSQFRFAEVIKLNAEVDKFLLENDNPYQVADWDEKEIFGIPFKDVRLASNLMASVLLGKIEKAQFYSRQLKLRGIKHDSFYFLHTEFFD